jgi:hypothetical protein
MAAPAAPPSLNEQLMDAVCYFRVADVRSALERGANPNCCRPDKDADTEPDFDERLHPSSPLRLVMFRLSDCDLSDEQRGLFGEIARILLAAGADPLSAMVIAESRYGPYDPAAEADPFQQVWTIVAQAAAALQAPPTEQASTSKLESSEAS